MLGSLITALMLALPPSVSIDTSPLDGIFDPTVASRFHGELVGRLVEEGFAVGGDSDARLAFRVEDDAVVIEVSSDEHSASTTVPIGDAAAILSLELVHRSAALLISLGVEHPGDAPYPDAAVLETTDVGETLPLELAQLLVDRGYVLVRDPQAARWRVCVAGREDRFAVAVVEADTSCAPALAAAEVVDDPADRVEAALLAASWPDDVDDVDDAVLPTTPLTDAHRPAAAPSPSRSAPWRFGLGVFGGAQARLSAAEGVVGLVADAVHPVGFAIITRATVAPSRGPGLRVFDAFVAGGVGYRSRVRGRVSLWAGALAGLLVHRYSFESEVEHAVDLDLELPLGLGIELTHRLDVTVDGLAAFTPRPIQHTSRGQALWTRDRWRLGGALGLRYTWGR